MSTDTTKTAKTTPVIKRKASKKINDATFECERCGVLVNKVKFTIRCGVICKACKFEFA